MKVRIIMRNRDRFYFEKEDLNYETFTKFIEMLGNKCDAFLHWDGQAVNIRNISSIDIMNEEE